MKKITIKDLTMTALFTALVFVATVFINIRLPINANGGLIHLGNVPLFVCAGLFGSKKSAFAGGVGMALFDLMGGWLVWAPFTLVIVGLMGYVAGLICEKSKKIYMIFVAMGLALVIKIVGYYIAEMIIYHNAIVPLVSIPGNIIQVIVAAIISFPIILSLRRVIK